MHNCGVPFINKYSILLLLLVYHKVLHVFLLQKEVPCLNVLPRRPLGEAAPSLSDIYLVMNVGAMPKETNCDASI
jgi:hypothetical protein